MEIFRVPATNGNSETRLSVRFGVSADSTGWSIQRSHCRGAHVQRDVDAPARRDVQQRTRKASLNTERAAQPSKPRAGRHEHAAPARLAIQRRPFRLFSLDATRPRHRVGLRRARAHGHVLVSDRGILGVGLTSRLRSCGLISPERPVSHLASSPFTGRLQHREQLRHPLGSGRFHD